MIRAAKPRREQRGPRGAHHQHAGVEPRVRPGGGSKSIERKQREAERGAVEAMEKAQRARTSPASIIAVLGRHFEAEIPFRLCACRPTRHASGPGKRLESEARVAKPRPERRRRAPQRPARSIPPSLPQLRCRARRFDRLVEHEAYVGRRVRKEAVGVRDRAHQMSVCLSGRRDQHRRRQRDGHAGA